MLAVDGWAVTFCTARPFLAVPNVTAQPSTVSVQITVFMYSDWFLCGFNMPIKA